MRAKKQKIECSCGFKVHNSSLDYLFTKVSLVISYLCNNRCEFCYARDAVASSYSRMKYSDFKLIVGLLAEVGTKGIDLIGGEPTLHPDLLKMIRYIRKKDITVFLITNGRRFADYEFLEKVVVAGVDYISTSVPVYDEKSARNVLGSARAYKDLEKGLQNEKKFKDKVNTCLHVVVENTNVDYYKRLFDLIIRLGFKSCSIGINNSSIWSTNGEGVLSHKDAASMIRVLDKEATERELDVKFLSKMPLCFFDKKEANSLLVRERITSNCRVYQARYLTVEPDGSILPCTYFVRHPVGNILSEFYDTKSKKLNTEKFLKEWKNGKYSSFREKSFKYRSSKCVNCDFFPKKCSGGCMLSYLGQDPEKIIPGFNHKKQSLQV